MHNYDISSYDMKKNVPQKTSEEAPCFNKDKDREACFEVLS